MYKKFNGDHILSLFEPGDCGIYASPMGSLRSSHSRCLQTN